MSLKPILESVTKFRIRNPNSSNKLHASDFFRWSSDNFYRTSTGDMGDLSAKVN